MPRRRVLAVLALLLLSLTVAFSFWRINPRVPEDASGVSLARLRHHVADVAREPHPVESDANRRVRDYILAELRALGLSAEVQTGRILSPRGVPVTVENIVCRIPGGGEGNAGGLLVCHYDSHPRAPGAGDDANAVAAMLEIARLLAARQAPPERDIVLLFTDGEEAGLLGAQVWVADNPDLMACRVVANFEARGSSGPAVMFETAGAPVDLFRNGYVRRSPWPVTSSISSAVYERMPNGTDFTVFRLAGMSGLNFAFIDGFANYHTPNDDPGHLSDASLLHQAQQMHAVAEYFATAEEADFAKNTGSRPLGLVYFDLAALGVVSYPDRLAIPLAVVAGIAGTAAIVRLRPRPAPLGLAFLRQGLVLLVVLGWVHLLTMLPMTSETHHWTAVAFAGAGMLVLASLPFAGADRLLRGRRRAMTSRGQRERAALAALLSLLMAGTIWSAGWFVPGSYALAWPTLMLGLAACLRRPRWRAAALIVAAAVSTLILLPLAWLVTVAMTLQLLALGTALLTLIGWIWRPAVSPLLRPAWPATAIGVFAGAAAFAFVFLA